MNSKEFPLLERMRLLFEFALVHQRCHLQDVLNHTLHMIVFPRTSHLSTGLSLFLSLSDNDHDHSVASLSVRTALIYPEYPWPIRCLAQSPHHPEQ